MRPLHLPVVISRFLVCLLLFAFWEAGARLFGDPLFVSPPSGALAASVEILQDAGVRGAVALTGLQLIVSFLLSVAIGLPAGIAIGWLPLLRHSTYPIVLMIYATPSIVFVPILVLWVGIGFNLAIVMGVLNGSIPILIAVVSGVGSIKAHYLKAARSMGAGPFQTFWYVICPSIAPSFFSGLRISISATLIGVMLAELYVSQNGIGFYAKQFADTFASAKVFALVAIVSIFAIILNEIARAAERRFQQWAQ